MSRVQTLEGTFGHGGGLGAAARLIGMREAELDDFSTNCFFAASPLTENLLGGQGRFSGAALLHYPDPEVRRLRARLAVREALPADMIVAGNGASELIWASLLALRGKGARRALFLGPIFVQYARACAALGLEQEHVVCREENAFLPDDSALDSVARSRADLVIVCSPNNPGTGVLRDFTPLMNAVGKRTLLLDACYRSFLQEEDPGFPRYSRLMEFACPGGEAILLDSLTKFFCCPGVRLGFAVTGKELAAGIESCRPSWSVGMAAEDAGLTLLEKESAYRELLPALAEDVENLARHLEKSGMFRRVLRGTSFVAAAVKDGRAADMQERLLRLHGILIRVCDNVPGMPGGWVRIQARPESYMQRLYAALPA